LQLQGFLAYHGQRFCYKCANFGDLCLFWKIDINIVVFATV